MENSQSSEVPVFEEGRAVVEPSAFAEAPAVEPIAAADTRLPRVAMVDLSGLRRKRDELRAACDAARASWVGAKRRRAEHVAGLAGGAANAGFRGSASDASHVINEDVESFAATLQSRAEALAIVERELAGHETPERLAAVAAQSAEWTKARADVLRIVGEIRQGAVYLETRFAELAAAQGRMAAAINGEALPVREFADGDRSRWARLLAPLLARYVKLDPFDADWADRTEDWPAREAAQTYMAPDLLERYG